MPEIALELDLPTEVEGKAETVQVEYYPDIEAESLDPLTLAATSLAIGLAALGSAKWIGRRLHQAIERVRYKV